MIWGKRKKANGTTNRRSVSGKLGRALLAILLAATLIPCSPETPQAEAMEGTNNYSILYDIQNIDGTPALIEGNTLRVASTLDSKHYDFYSKPYLVRSTAGFKPKRTISLLSSWTLRLRSNITPLTSSEMNKKFYDVYISLGLGDSDTYSELDGIGICILGQIQVAGMSAPLTESYIMRLAKGENGEKLVYRNPTFPSSPPSVTIAYDAPTDTFTASMNGEQLTALDNFRTTYLGSDRAYLHITGGAEWSNENEPNYSTTNPEKRAPDTTRSISVSFESMSLPHLDPEISGIKLYRKNPTTGVFDLPVKKDDELEPNEIVRAVCTVRNINAGSITGSFREQFDMHLKLADTDAYPTRGIAPFADAAHPLQVDGKTVATAPGDNTLTGANGVPLTLVGTTPVEVSYYAKVNQGSAAVSVSHELIEDSFQGSQLKTVELLPKRALVPGDPDDPTLKPGTDYHYTRLPAANENGWNGIATSPVDVTFYAGDFDRFTVTGADGSALGTLSGGQKWTQSADVDALPVTYQAKNTVSEALSTTGEDTIRIDTQAPSLSHDADTGTLSADDTGAAGKATSGIWKIERVKADGRALGTEDITPQSHAAAAYADEQTRWDFPLTDGKGAATQAVADAQPGFYVATDAAGNRSAVFEVKEPETPVDPGPDEPTPPVDPTPDTPNKPGTDDPSGNNPGTDKPVAPTVTPKPSGDGDDPAPKPLAPTVTDKDPTTGLQHDTVEHALTLPTAPGSITPAMMGQLIADRYVVTANRPDGAITAGQVSLFDAAGNPVAAIDRTRPGTWVAEQTFTDSAGNSTTIRLAITVKENTISGTISSEGDGTAGSSNSAGSGSGTNGSNGTGTGNALLTRLTDLPQTGGLIGPCPLHILFLLMIFAVSAYSVLRLTDEPRRRNSDAYRNDEVLRARRYTVFDGLVHGVVALCAVALALRPFCLYDLLWAAATVVVVLFWSALFLHRSRSAKRAAAR